ncbi:MAG: Gfo/Idh/MocA family oxidoreductase [Chthoniobacteraceae bacterium]
MRILIVSLGSIGRRHVTNLRQLEPTAEVCLLRRAVDPTLDETQVTTLEAALAFAPDAALICSPAPQHIEVATALAARGVALFIEKPLSHDLAGVTELLTLAREKGTPLMVGYCLRYFAPLRALRDEVLAGKIGRLLHIHTEVGQHLADWRPGSNYRNSVTAQRALGGGALLELSHEIDTALWFGGEVESVTAQLGTLGDLGLDVEDTADLQLRFRNGILGTIHLDLRQRPARRVCRLIGTGGTLTLDLLAATADRNAMYLEELRHFLDCARTRRQPEISGEDGLRVLEVIAAARRSKNQTLSS